MKETVGSLRAYFIIVGIWRLVASGLTTVAAIALLALDPGAVAISLIALSGLGVVVSLAFIVCGIALPTFLRTSVPLLNLVVLVNLVLQIATAIFCLATGSGITGVILPLVIAAYLFKAVKRLAS